MGAPFIAMLAVLFGALGFLNVWASARALRDETSSVPQKVTQVIAVWVLPFAGALLVLQLLRKDPEPGSGKYAVGAEGNESEEESIPATQSSTGTSDSPD